MESNYDPYVRVLRSEGDGEDDLVPWCTDGDHGRCKAYLAKVISVDEDGSCDELGEDDSAEEYPPLVITENGMYDAVPDRAQTNASFTSLSRGFRGCTYGGEAKEVMFGENLNVSMPLIYNSEGVYNESEIKEQVYDMDEGAADPSTDDVTFENREEVSLVGEESVDDPSGGSEPRAPSQELAEVASEPSGAGDDVTDNREYMGRPRNNLVTREYLKISGILGFAAELINTTLPGDEGHPSRNNADDSAERGLLSRPWEKAVCGTPPEGRAPDAPALGRETENNKSNAKRAQLGHVIGQGLDAPDLSRTKARAGGDARDVIKPFVLSDLKRLREERRVSVDEGEIAEEDKGSECGDEESHDDKTEEGERSAGEEEEDLENGINVQEYKEVKAVFVKECVVEEEEEEKGDKEEGSEEMIDTGGTENMITEEDKKEIGESTEPEEKEGGNEIEAEQEEPQEELQHSREENVAEKLPCEEHSRVEHPQENGESVLSSENSSCEEQSPVERSTEGNVDGSFHEEYASYHCEEQASDEPSPAEHCEEDPSSEGHHCEEHPSVEELFEDSSAKEVKERTSGEFLREEHGYPSERFVQQEPFQELFIEKKSPKDDSEVHSNSNEECLFNDHSDQEHSFEEHPLEPPSSAEERLCTDGPSEEPLLENLIDLSEHTLEEQPNPCGGNPTEDQPGDLREHACVEENPEFSELHPIEEQPKDDDHLSEEEQSLGCHSSDLRSTEEQLGEHFIVNEHDNESLQEQQTNEELSVGQDVGSQLDEEQDFEKKSEEEQDTEEYSSKEQDNEEQAFEEQDTKNQPSEEQNGKKSMCGPQLEKEQSVKRSEDHLTKEQGVDDGTGEEHPCEGESGEEQVGELKAGAELDVADPVIEIDVGERTAGSGETATADVDADRISIVSADDKSGCSADVPDDSGDEGNYVDLVSGSDRGSEGEKGGLAPTGPGQGDSDVISNIPSGPESDAGSGSPVDGEAGDSSALCCLEQDCHDEERVPEEVRGGEEHPCHEGDVLGREAERAWASAEVQGVTKEEHDVDPRTYAVSSQEQVDDGGGESSTDDETLRDAQSEPREPASPSETLPSEEIESSPVGSLGRVSQEEAFEAATPKKQYKESEKDSGPEELQQEEGASGCVPCGSRVERGECCLCASAASAGERPGGYIVECQDRGTVVVGVRGVTFVEPLPFRDRYSPEVSIIWEEDTEVGDGESCDAAPGNKPEIAKDSSLEGDFDSITLEDVAADAVRESVAEGQPVVSSDILDVPTEFADDLALACTNEEVPGVSAGEAGATDEFPPPTEGDADISSSSLVAPAEVEEAAELAETALGNLQEEATRTDDECLTSVAVQDSLSFRVGAGEADEVNEVNGGRAEEPIVEVVVSTAEETEANNIIAKECEVRGEEASGDHDAGGGDNELIRGSDKCGEVSERDRDEIGREESPDECAGEGEGEEERRGNNDEVLESLLMLRSANSVECDEEWSAVDLVVSEARGDQSSQEKVVKVSVKVIEENSSQREASADLKAENPPRADSSAAEACAEAPKATMSDSSNRDSGTSYLSEGEDSDDDTLEGRNSDGDAMMVSSTDEGSNGSGGSSGGGTGGTGGSEAFSKSHRREDSGVEVGLEAPSQLLYGPVTPPRQRHASCDTQSEADPNDTTLTGPEGGSEASEAEDGGEGTLRFRRSRSHQFRMGRRFSSGHKMMEKVRKAVHFGRKTLLDDSAIDVHNTKHDANNAASFGKRSGGGGRRANECLILEPSEMIVIDYPDVQLMRPGQRASCNTMNLEKLMALEQDEITIRPGGRGAPPPPPTHHHAHHQYENDHAHHHHHPQHHHHHHDPYLPDLVGSAILRGARSRGSVGSSVRDGSDTSSAYSGSDTMCHSLQSSLEPDDVDLSGLTESAVDSDEEDLAESIESLAVRDAVRECLEKDPSERTEDDIDVLLEFTQRLRAFSNMTLAVRRAMCQAMVFAVVEEAGTTLMNHGEELDSWSVIINGHVEVTQPDGSVHELHLGDSLPKRQNVMTKNSSSSASFGITPTMEKLYHQGVMRSKVDDCQFVCIRQTDYYRILHQGEENTRRHEEDGVLVLVTEQRPIDAGNRRGNIVIKGTAERLMSQLVEVENNVDPTYVEDFLLTHRTFIDNPLQVANKLLEWFEDPSLRDRVTRVVLLWVNNHFTDFEMDPVMMNFLEQFEEGLEREKMAGQLRLLDFACATKARARTVTLTRPSRDEILHFSILGGYERGFGIFISKVEKGSKAEEVGLKRGDQILEVNGQSFDHMNHGRALEILRQTCHLSITVKSNLLAFKEMLQTPDNSPRQRPRKPSDPRGLNDGNLPLNPNFASTMNIPSDHTQQSPRDKGKDNNNKTSFMTMSGTKANRFRKVKNLLKPKTNTQESQINSDESVSSQSSVGGGLYHSHSNPDLSTTGAYEDVRTEFPEHVLKVYRATDQAARFLPVHKETTAREVVMLALQIFNINDPSGSSNYALYEVSVTEEGLTKQKRLPDSLQNLAERIGLSSRYYLKNITVSQTLVPDENVNELVRESTVYFLQLNSVELAIQLTLEDYTIFRQIEPTEYIDYLFHLNSRYGTPALSQFAELVNREMFWVVTEVCSEHNLVKRSKIIKQFIKVARQCKECKNFNSMFAILSGLGHGTVSRLKQTWERLPSKYQRMFHDMQDLMDPSRNMSKYRNLVQSENIQSPIIPFYPVVARDLTFTHEGNDDKVEGLINFEKLRMISRYIRDLQNMCSAPYDLFNMQDAGGQPPSAALITLNQMGAQIATVKRRKKSTAAPDKKKMYEEAQMVRRVKAYLSRLQVITDEEQLRNMSLECEAGPEGHKPAGGHSNSSSSGSSSAPPTNPPPRRRPHSPTPSTTSSTSSTSQTSDGKKHTAKFGSVTSTDCQVGPGESDSGISTHFDCHSSSSLEVGGVSGYECHYHSSPPAHHRRYSHQPAGMGSGRRRGAPGHPPDYAETQMRMKQMGRALSHDGVQYYRQTHLDGIFR
ncbi:uncharacterized protein PDZ-GEF isoform X12 [Penaeus vannamei]|uniref:uncharacterized protein PDZ-GEF isoform X12 n=1 Tax=Penaeus vannamei TaxID=6689 RepID=UPI00387F8F64